MQDSYENEGMGRGDLIPPSPAKSQLDSAGGFHMKLVAIDQTFNSQTQVVSESLDSPDSTSSHEEGDNDDDDEDVKFDLESPLKKKQRMSKSTPQRNEDLSAQQSALNRRNNCPQILRISLQNAAQVNEDNLDSYMKESSPAKSNSTQQKRGKSLFSIIPVDLSSESSIKTQDEEIQNSKYLLKDVYGGQNQQRLGLNLQFLQEDMDEEDLDSSSSRLGTFAQIPQIGVSQLENELKRTSKSPQAGQTKQSFPDISPQNRNFMRSKTFMPRVLDSSDPSSHSLSESDIQTIQEEQSQTKSVVNPQKLEVPKQSPFLNTIANNIELAHKQKLLIPRTSTYKNKLLKNASCRSLINKQEMEFSVKHQNSFKTRKSSIYDSAMNYNSFEPSLKQQAKLPFQIQKKTLYSKKMFKEFSSMKSVLKPRLRYLVAKKRFEKNQEQSRDDLNQRFSSAISLGETHNPRPSQDQNNGLQDTENQNQDDLSDETDSIYSEAQSQLNSQAEESADLDISKGFKINSSQFKNPKYAKTRSQKKSTPHPCSRFCPCLAQNRNKIADESRIKQDDGDSKTPPTSSRALLNPKSGEKPENLNQDEEERGQILISGPFISYYLHKRYIIVHGKKVYGYTLNAFNAIGYEVKLRQLAIWINEWPWFDQIIMVLIMINSISLGFLDYQYSNLSQEYPTKFNENRPIITGIIQDSEIFFTLIYIAELLIKTLAMGLFFDKNCYLRKYSNWLDAIIVISSLIYYIPNTHNLTFMRIFRLLKPLRNLKQLKQLQQVVVTAMESAPLLMTIFFMQIFSLFLFAILGTNMWSGITHQRCRMTPEPVNGTWPIVPDDPLICGGLHQCNEDIGQVCGSLYDQKYDEILRGYRNQTFFEETFTEELLWGNFNFDNVLSSFGQTIHALTSTGWFEIAKILIDGYNFDIVLLYFISLLKICHYLFINLTLAVLVTTLMNQKGSLISHLIDQKQKLFNYVKQRKKTLGIVRTEDEASLLKNPLKAISNCMTIFCFYEVKEEPMSARYNYRIFQFCWRICSNPLFELILICVLIVNDALLAFDRVNLENEELEVYNSPMLLTLHIINIILVLETVLKLCAFEVKVYFGSVANIVDLTLSCLFMTTIIIDLIKAEEFKLSNLQDVSLMTLTQTYLPFQAIRSIRLLILVQLSKSLQGLQECLVYTLNKIILFFPLLFLFLYVYTLFGMQFFAGKLKFQEDGRKVEFDASFTLTDFNQYQSPRSNFDTFDQASRTVFQILLGEQWEHIFYNCVRSVGFVITSIYFIGLIVFGNIILIQLFLAQLLVNFETVQFSIQIRDLSKYLAKIQPSILNSSKTQEIEPEQTQRVCPILKEETWKHEDIKDMTKEDLTKKFERFMKKKKSGKKEDSFSKDQPSDSKRDKEYNDQKQYIDSSFNSDVPSVQLEQVQQKYNKKEARELQSPSQKVKRIRTVSIHEDNIDADIKSGSKIVTNLNEPLEELAQKKSEHQTDLIKIGQNRRMVRIMTERKIVPLQIERKETKRQRSSLLIPQTVQNVDEQEAISPVFRPTNSRRASIFGSTHPLFPEEFVETNHKNKLKNSILIRSISKVTGTSAEQRQRNKIVRYLEGEDENCVQSMRESSLLCFRKQSKCRKFMVELTREGMERPTFFTIDSLLQFYSQQPVFLPQEDKLEVNSTSSEITNSLSRSTSTNQDIEEQEQTNSLPHQEELERCWMNSEFNIRKVTNQGNQIKKMQSSRLYDHVFFQGQIKNNGKFYLDDHFIIKILWPKWYHVSFYKVCKLLKFIVIILSSLLLLFKSPIYDIRSLKCKIILGIDTGFTTFYFLEFICKAIANGFCCNASNKRKKSTAYLCQFWNIFDFVLLIVALIDIIASYSLYYEENSKVMWKIRQVVRCLTALRPLTLIKFNNVFTQTSKLFFGSLFESLKMIVFVLIAMFIYAIIGVYLFKGSFYRCVIDGDDFTATHDDRILTKQDCLDLGYTWENSIANFDNIQNSLFILAIMMQNQNWVNVMYMGIDSRGINLQPKANSRVSVCLYFVSFMFLTFLFTLNLLRAIIIGLFNYQNERNMGYLGKNVHERQWISLQRLMMKLNLEKKSFQPQHRFRLLFYKICLSPVFDIIVFFVILSNLVMFSIPYLGMPKKYVEVFDTLSYSFLAFYNIEFLIKIIGLQMKYFQDQWNQVDFLILVSSNISLLNDLFFGKMSNNLTMLIRALRVIRVLKIIKLNHSLSLLMSSMYVSTHNLFQSLILFWICIYVYAIFGMNQFYNIKYGDFYNEYSNFRSFNATLIILFRVITNDNWYNLMMETSNQEDCIHDQSLQSMQNDKLQGCGTPLALFYFASVILVFRVLFLSIITAIVLEAFKSVRSEKTSVITREDYHCLLRAWSEYDPMATGLINPHDVCFLVFELEGILGSASQYQEILKGIIEKHQEAVSSENGTAEGIKRNRYELRFDNKMILPVSQMIELLKNLQLPIYIQNEGQKCHFKDVALALSRRVLLKNGYNEKIFRERNPGLEQEWLQHHNKLNQLVRMTEQASEGFWVCMFVSRLMHTVIEKRRTKMLMNKVRQNAISEIKKMQNYHKMLREQEKLEEMQLTNPKTNKVKVLGQKVTFEFEDDNTEPIQQYERELVKEIQKKIKSFKRKKEGVLLSSDEDSDQLREKYTPKINKGIDVRGFFKQQQKNKQIDVPVSQNKTSEIQLKIENLTKEKDSRRSLWWLDEGHKASSITKIKRWIEVNDIRYYGVRKQKHEEIEEEKQVDNALKSALIQVIEPEKSPENDCNLKVPNQQISEKEKLLQEQAQLRKQFYKLFGEDSDDENDSSRPPTPEQLKPKKLERVIGKNITVKMKDIEAISKKFKRPSKLTKIPTLRQTKDENVAEFEMAKQQHLGLLKKLTFKQPSEGIILEEEENEGSSKISRSPMMAKNNSQGKWFKKVSARSYQNSLTSFERLKEQSDKDEKINISELKNLAPILKNSKKQDNSSNIDLVKSSRQNNVKREINFQLDNVNEESQSSSLSGSFSMTSEDIE